MTCEFVAARGKTQTSPSSPTTSPCPPSEHLLGVLLGGRPAAPAARPPASASRGRRAAAPASRRRGVGEGGGRSSNTNRRGIRYCCSLRRQNRVPRAWPKFGLGMRKGFRALSIPMPQRLSESRADSLPGRIGHAARTAARGNLSASAWSRETAMLRRRAWIDGLPSMRVRARETWNSAAGPRAGLSDGPNFLRCLVGRRWEWTRAMRRGGARAALGGKRPCAGLPQDLRLLGTCPPPRCPGPVRGWQ